MEIVSAILYQLTRNLTPEEIKASGFAASEQVNIIADC